MSRYGIKDDKQTTKGASPDVGAHGFSSGVSTNTGSRVPSAPTHGYGMRNQESSYDTHEQNPRAYVYESSNTAQDFVQPQKNVVATAQVQSTQTKKKKRGASFWVAIIVAILCLLLAGILAFTMFGPTKGTRQGDAGQLDNKTDAEIQAELDRIVDEGMFNISIASVVAFPTGTSEGELRIENVPGNRYLMRVEITRDDTGEVIYTTDFIEPNHHIQKDVLDVNLSQGEYPSTAIFYAYDPDTEELIGQAAAKMVIQIES